MDLAASFFSRHSIWPLLAVLLSLLVGLQYRLWQEWQKIEQYDRQIAAQIEENQRLLERNQFIEWDIKDLKEGSEATEERARHDLDMVKDDEILYYIPQQ